MIKKEVFKNIPQYVTNVADRLISNGYEAHLVGGSLRDLIIGRKPSDFDIATNALPEQVQSIFQKTISTGIRFGTVLVLETDDNGETFEVEVTTYRSEADYFGGRWPAKINFADNIEEDLSRRDFTINSMALDLACVDLSNIEFAFKDPYNGINDIQNKFIRSVGNPIERFKEDGLRSIRACRFASTLEFDIEERTFEAIRKTLDVTRMVSIERVREELEKMMMNSSKPSIGFRMLSKAGILEIFIPELEKAKQFDQPDYHSDNVFEHSLKTMDIAEDRIKWVALFHDIGKILTRTEDKKGIHYYGHDLEGAKLSREILMRLRFNKKQIQNISNLIRWHMFYYPSADWRKENAFKTANKDIQKNTHGWSDAAVRRFIKNIGGQENFEDLIRLRIADANSNQKSDFDPQEIEEFQKRVSKIIAEESALKFSDLMINGNDLIQMGYTPGPMLREILEFVLDKVIEDPNINSKTKLQEIIINSFTFK